MTTGSTGAGSRLFISSDTSREVWGYSLRDRGGPNGWGSFHPGALVVDPAANVLYGGGGYEGHNGLTATNIDTEAIDASLPELGLGWVTGMAVAGKTLYFAAGEDATIYAHPTTSAVSDPLSYTKLGSLGKIGQSMARAWASTGTHVVFGAIPTGTDYYDGIAPAGTTGAIGIIETATRKLTTRQDLFPGHYLTYLTALNGTVYGTTRPVEHTNPSAPAPILFALDPATGAVRWRKEFPGTFFTGLATLEGKLYVATATDVHELAPGDGAQARSFTLPAPEASTQPPFVKFVAVPSAKRLLHFSQAGKTVISTRTGKVFTAGRSSGGQFFTDARGTVWVPQEAGHGPLRMEHAMADGARYRGPWASPFADVSTTTQFYKEMAWLAETGVSTGWDNGNGTFSYRPLSPVNRDAMAAFLYRLAGSPAYTAPAKSPFADITPKTKFYKEMAWLASTGVSTGWDGPNGTKLYKPLSPVNRDAMAAFMYRLAGSPAYTAPARSPFADITPKTKFYKEMAWLASLGISTGWDGPNGTKLYKPLSPVNRDAMAAFMYRLAATAL